MILPPSPTSRGIYLRDSCYCHQSTEWTVQVDPTFHDDASNMEQLVPFEECIELHSTGEAVVKAPGFLLLTHNGRTFNIVVDPTNLSDGLHYYEVYGVDCNAPWRGPLFRIPITITKPISVRSRPPLISFTGMPFVPEVAIMSEILVKRDQSLNPHGLSHMLGNSLEILFQKMKGIALSLPITSDLTPKTLKHKSYVKLLMLRKFYKMKVL
ncbi:hypothetical protein POM88_001608 [Heracleum sosnowskyi]|uniref:Tripeptidyl-peptidase II first Ig-like domain-containing protein n=1 Tax=Heracleum sosnowskyi TaxID=360622 RepID=A0AAD8NBU4_9APIA|nr:hypothetical protein POM88_001608 [Heracleum sosnowskyi]